MKVHFLLPLFLLFCFLSKANNAVELRNQFEEACSNERKADLLFNTLNSFEGVNELVSGYTGATQSVLARYSMNPLTKFRLCKNGLSRLNKAIDSAPALMELRYLRLIIEYHLPSILNMSDHIDADKKVILDLLPASQDHDLNRRVISFLITKNICTAEEKRKLSAH